MQRTTWFLAATFAIVFAHASRGIEPTPAPSFNVSEHADWEGIDEATPAAAANGRNCLVVWKDNRAARQPYHRGEYLLYARRFDASGSPIDNASFPIHDEPFLWNNEGLTLPAVTTLGPDYLVVWVTRLRHVSARRVTSDGMLAAGEIAIGRSGNASGQPAVATSRRGALVAWTSRTNNNGDVYATLLDRHGAVTAVVPISVDAANAQHPVAASVGRNYLVLWRELKTSGEGIVRAACVTASGDVRRLDDFPERAADWLTVAANGRSYFVAWQRPGGASAALFGSVVNGRGKVLRDEVPLASCGHDQTLPLPFPSSRNFILSWRENPYSSDAKLFALPISARGVAKSEPMPLASDGGWFGYGSASGVTRSSALVVLEQKTPDYYENGYQSRVRGSIINSEY